MKVEDLLRAKGGEVVTMPREETIATAGMRMMEARIGAVVICDADHRPHGVLSERDIVHGLSKHGEAVLSMTIGSLMQPRVVTCTPQDSLLRVMALMTDRRVRHVPVVDDAGRLCGIVSVGDAVKGRMEEIETEAKALRDYINMA